MTIYDIQNGYQKHYSENRNMYYINLQILFFSLNLFILIRG